ncbi:polysaccharide deacetylase family protein [Neobacillus sp. D3-1R]|uniref:polysaccharide deacetylase family protein n=1 Tax=Neobacillus sp. D3-1R TaxID=3445778 RepID=UPI003FA15B2D
MKKGWVYFFFLILFLFSFDGEAAATSNVKYIPIAINDEWINFPDALPFVKEQTTYIPIRFLSDAMGATLTVDKTEGSITITSPKNSIKLMTKQNEMITLEGTRIKINNFVQDGRTYAPLRDLGKYFGYDVQYLSKGPIVRLVNSDAKTDTEQFLIENEKQIKEFYQKLIWENRPKVYLTFDDGPSIGMEEILNVLKAKKAKASFFMIETQMKKFPEDVKHLVKEGHYPALHSVSHNKSLLYGGKASAVSMEMLKAQKTLYSITGIQSSLTRAPFGSKPYMTNPFRDEMAKQKLKMWDWNIDSEDWKYAGKNPMEIVSNVKEGFQKLKERKEPIVILFHVKKETALVLPEIIDFIYSQGYQCVAYQPADHFVMNFWKDKRL